MELVDEARAFNPAKELQSDWQLVLKEALKVQQEKNALEKTWILLSGPAGDPIPPPPPALPPAVIRPPVRDCLASLGAPTIASTQDCLDQLFRAETSGIWNPSEAPYRNEDAFRELIVDLNDVILHVKALSSTAAEGLATMQAQIASLDSDAFQLNADLNTLLTNLKAAEEAVAVYGTLTASMKNGDANRSVLNNLRRAEIRAKLVQDLTPATANGKPVLGESGINALVDAFMIDTVGNRRNDGRDALILAFEDINRNRNDRLQALGGNANEPYAVAAANAIDASLIHINVDLPAAIDTINAKQSRILARANEIYDKSAVRDPLDKFIDLSKYSGNLLVYVTVRRVDVFPRYNVPSNSVQIASQSAGTPAPTLVALTTPAATATTTAATTTATAAATPTPTPAPTPDTSTGTVVAHGSFEVHDVYHATVIGAFAVSFVKDRTITSKPVSSGPAVDGTTCTATNPCQTPFVDKGGNQVSALVGIAYYFKPHDTYPQVTNTWKQKMAGFGGVSASRANSYFLGITCEPVSTFQVTGGLNFVLQDAISGQFDTSKAYPGTSNNFGGSSKWDKGAFVSAGFYLSIFRKVFGSVTGLGTKTSGTGN